MISWEIPYENGGFWLGLGKIDKIASGFILNMASWEIPDENGGFWLYLLMGKSMINGGFSSTPCLMTLEGILK